MANLAAKYRPKVFEDVSEQSVIVNMLENMCSQDNLNHRNFLFIGPAGCGKAQPLDSEILTPNGFIRMQDVEIGTEVFTHKGNIGKVSGVYPQGVRPIYEIRFQDRTKIKVSDEHLNIVYTHDTNTGEYKEYVLTTLELKHLFETSEPHIRFNTYLPKVDWSNSSSTYLTTPYQTGTSCAIDALSIPKEYLLTSKQVREEVLQGLLDTHGYVDQAGYLCWRTTSAELSQNFAFLTRSLGIRDTIDSVSLGSTMKSKLYTHTLLLPKSIDTFCYASFENPLVFEDKDICRRIVSIKRCKDEECQCIMVDHEDHTYISDGFIPTHNTTLARILADKVNDGKGTPIEVDAASNNGVDSVRELVKQMKSYPVGFNYKVFIFDECFPKGTLVRTPKGTSCIEDIKPGDAVYNMIGTATVSNVFRNIVGVDRLICIKFTNGHRVITTKDHLVFTDSGWVNAIDLLKGDLLYDYTSTQQLQQVDLGSEFSQFEVDLYRDMSTRFNSSHDVSIFSLDTIAEKPQQESTIYQLRTLPHLTEISDKYRGQWSRLQEIELVIKQKKSNISREFKVESVEIYRPDNSELFLSSFSSEELNSGYVEMFDLEIEGHPSYYANDVLVHNCHAFSNTAWQAMLKPIEEQPAKTIIMLCTTNPEKIPATILSRVQTFQLSKISLQGITSRLIHIIESEKAEGNDIIYTEDAVAYIAKLANGGMRDSITLLEKSLSYSSDITIENLVKSLDLPNYDDYFILLNGIAKKDNKVIVSLIDNVYNSGVNFVKWFEGFHSFVSNIIKYIFIQDINSTIIPGYYQDKIANYGIGHATLCLKLANKLVKMNQELKNTQYLQELAITYLCSVPQK